MIRCHASLFLCLAVACWGSLPLCAQEAPAALDSSYEARIDEAWAAIHSSGDEAAQRAFADEFFRYYLQHPDSETGRRAVASAFTMWGNVGAADRVDAALPHVSTEWPYWGRLLNGITNAYFRYGARTREDYFALLQRLNQAVKHPRSRSAILMELGRHYQAAGDKATAASLYQEVTALGAHGIYARQAARYLHELTTLNVGQPAPYFRARTLAGDSLSLSDLRGKVVLLEFWATWCGPCIPEIPHLKQLQATHSPDDFQIIGISLDDDLEALQQFIEREAMLWPQIQQAAQWSGEVALLFNVNGIPRSYLIDRTGLIAAKDLRGEELQAAVDALLGDLEE